jgi:uncharacterized protein with HEPN domain
VSRSETERAADILSAIKAIKRFDALATASTDEVTIEAALDGICYHIIVIGEAVKSLESFFTQAHPTVPWSKIARMRDLITHHYHRRDLAVIRATIGEPLTALESALLENV